MMDLEEQARMVRPDPDTEYTLELLEPLGPIQARRMFGGWGLYLGGRIFGLMLERRLYLKTDELTRPAFESAGGEPFGYEGKGGRTVITSYWTPPTDAIDDAHALLPWARRAMEAAQRAAVKKKPARAAKKAPAVKKSSRRA